MSVLGASSTSSSSVSEDDDSELIRQAALFEERLREDGDAVWPAGLDHARIASVLKLLNAVMVPGSTCSLSTTSDEKPTIELPSTVGRFSVGEMVGHGGFGAVFKAHDSLLHRDVALKAVPRRASLETNGEDFRLREARAAARLNHPSLVPLYEVFEDDRYMYLVSEFCDGPTLSQYMYQNEGPLRPAWAVEIALKLAQAISHAHGRGLIHRDIKPSNVILVTEHADVDLLPFTPRLTDFGLVLDADNEAQHNEAQHKETKAGSRSRLIGTTLYMAPEQLMGDPHADARSSDVYALGLLLYQMLANELPYNSKSPMGIFQQICSGPIPEITNSKYPISSDLRAIYLKTLAKNPSDRYASAQLLADDLVRLQDDREVSARPISSVNRMARAIRRAPLLSASVFALVALIVASSALFAWDNKLLRQQQIALEQAVSDASSSRRDAVEIAYRSNMNQAYLAVAKQDPATAMSFVNDIQGYSGDEYDDRFDFRLLKTLAKDGWNELAGLGAVVEEVVVMPKLNLFAVAGGDLLRIYRSDQHQPVREIKMAEGEVIHALAVAPDEDLLAIGVSGEASVWTWMGFNNDRVQFISLSDRQVPQPIKGFNATLESLAWNDDGTRIAVGTRYEPIQVFTLNVTADAITNDTITLDSTRRNEDLVFGPNNELAWFPTKMELKIESLDDTSHSHSLRLPNEGLGRRMHRSADGQLAVVTLHHETRGFLYGLEPDPDETSILESSHGELTSVCISPKGNYVTGGTNGGGVVVWDLATDKHNDLENVDSKKDSNANGGNRTDNDQGLIAEQKHHSIHGGSVTAIAVNDDGTIVSGSDDGSLAAWTTRRVKSLCQSLSVDDQSYCADISPDGKTVFVGCFDGSVWRIELATGSRKLIRDAIHVQTTALTVTKDGRYVAIGWADGSIAISKMTPIPVWSSLSLDRLPDDEIQDVTHLNFNPSSSQLYVCRSSSRFELFDVTEGSPSGGQIALRSVISFHAPSSIDALSILDDETVIALGDTIRTWNTKSNVLPASKVGIRHVQRQCTDHEDRLIYAGGKDGRIRKFNDAGAILSTSSRWAPIVTQPQTARQITSIALSPDRRSVLTGSNIGDIAIWDAESLRYLGEVLQGNGAGEIQRIRVTDDDAVAGGELLFAHQREFPVYGPKTNGKLRFIRLDSVANIVEEIPSANQSLSMASSGAQSK